MMQSHDPVQQNTPAANFFGAGGPGVSHDRQYLLIRRVDLERQDWGWQAAFLGSVRHMRGGETAEPSQAYRVVPLVRRPLTDMSSQQLAEVAVLAEVTATGDIVYRDLNTNQVIATPQDQYAWVSKPEPQNTATANRPLRPPA